MADVLRVRVPSTAPFAGAGGGGGGGTSRQSVMPSARGRRCRGRSVRRARGLDVAADGAVDSEAAADVAADVAEVFLSSRGSPPGAVLGVSPPPGPPFPLLPRLLPLAPLLATALPALATALPALATALPALATALPALATALVALAMPALAATAGGTAQLVRCSA
jgi:hypothetical protein